MESTRINANDSLTKKADVIGHAIISVVRPKSFLSPYQIGLAVYLHRHVGSRHVIALLNSMSLCTSYSEALHYEASAISCESESIAMKSFVQYVFDNADNNVRTFDGFNTFHGMGGIMCVTPSTAVSKAKEFERLKQVPVAMQLSCVNKLPVLTFVIYDNNGLTDITVQDLDEIRLLSPSNALMNAEVFWMCGSWLKVPDNPNWCGFMELY